MRSVAGARPAFAAHSTVLLPPAICSLVSSGTSTPSQLVLGHSKAIRMVVLTKEMVLDKTRLGR